MSAQDRACKDICAQPGFDGWALVGIVLRLAAVACNLDARTDRTPHSRVLLLFREVLNHVVQWLHYQRPRSLLHL